VKRPGGRAACPDDPLRGWRWTSGSREWVAAHRFGLALAAITVLAIALRLWRLPALGGYDWDEAATVFIAARPLSDLLAYLRGAPFEHPPLYYVLAHAWLALGPEETVLRALSVVLGALTVPVVGALGATLFGRRAGLLAAALLAVAPAHVFYSRDARMYPLLTLLLAVALYALVRAQRAAEHPGTVTGRAWPWWALWAGLSLLAVATHYYAVFAVGGQILYLLAARRVGRSGQIALGMTAGLAVLALAGWWALSPGLRHSLSGLRLAPLPPDVAALSLWRAVGGVLRGPLGDEPPLLDELGGALALAMLVGCAGLAWQRRRSGTRLLVLAGLAPLLSLIALMLLGRDLNARFLLMLLPCGLLAVAAGWDALGQRRRVGASLVLVAWGLAIAPWLGSYYAGYARGDYASALRWVESAERPGEAVVFNGPWQTLLFDHYYAGHLPRHVLTGAVPLVEPQVAAALGELAGRYDGVWLLETDMGNADPTEFVPRWLARHAYRQTAVNYRQVRVGHYLLAGPPLRAQPVAEALGDVELTELAVEEDGPRPGRASRVELVWRVGAALDAGLKVSVRLRDAAGGTWWGADPWLAESWLAPRAPRTGDLLYTRLAVNLPAAAPATAYTLQVVLYGSTPAPASGDGWVAWTSEPLLLPLAGPVGSDLVATPAPRPAN
jgi:mannosyltransferase